MRFPQKVLSNQGKFTDFPLTLVHDTYISEIQRHYRKYGTEAILLQKLRKTLIVSYLSTRDGATSPASD